MQLITIPAEELQQLLSDESTAEAALEKYFDYVFDKPMAGYYTIKKNVVLTYPEEENEKKGFIRNVILDLANRFSRKKRHKQYQEVLQQYPNRIRMVSEGDSWFQYPHPKVKDIIDHLMEDYAIYSLGAGGDELQNMFHEEEYYEAIDTINPQFLLLSAGGNDILGERFAGFLHNEYVLDEPGKHPERFLRDTYHAALEVVVVFYKNIFEKLQQDFPNLRIIVHGYDYIVPGSNRQKGWVGRYMMEKGIMHPLDKSALLCLVLDAFNDRLQVLTAQYANTTYLDIRKTTPNNLWWDEIHPNSEGFGLIAKKYRQVIHT